MLLGIVPTTVAQMDIFWKEVDGDSDWVGSLTDLSLHTFSMNSVSLYYECRATRVFFE